MEYKPVQTTPFSLTIKVKIRLWQVIQNTLFRWSPSPLRGFRRFLLRCFGANVASTASIHPQARIDCPWNLEMGDHASVGEHAWVYTLDKITIGDYACIGQRVQILTGSHDITDPSFRLVTRPVNIAKGVWIAASAIVLPGINIGEMSVVGAGSVVTKDVPAGVIVAGNPARVIKPRLMQADNTVDDVSATR
jgi:putative colanic acid biosynthesis acetyltransferase WcaF